MGRGAAKLYPEGEFAISITSPARNYKRIYDVFDGLRPKVHGDRDVLGGYRGLLTGRERLIVAREAILVAM